MVISMKSSEMQADQSPPTNGTEIAATCHGINVPMSPFLTEARINRINAHKYEGEEVDGALQVVRPGDRVLELGAGIGLVGAVISLNCTPAKVLSFEANPSLIEHIRKLHALNGLSERMEVRNQVLLSTADAPESISFHIRKSYLGSSLMERAAPAATRVDVPTARYAQVKEQFRPDVLIMDIEGGELDFLRHASLEGVRAVVIEFHPGMYGVEGMRECKRILTEAGFVKKSSHSSRKVWTCVRPDVAAPPLTTGGWSAEVETITDAIVVPPTVSGLVQASGALHPDGTYCANGALWRNGRALTTQPTPPQAPLRQRKGTWIWGGVLWMHFGHFMVESLSRLWLDWPEPDRIDGVLFTPKRPRNASDVLDYQQVLVREMGWDCPVHAVHEPAQIERLIVPGQGFGLGPMITGTTAFRNRIRSHFGASIPPDGPEKIYVSRSALPSGRGRLIGEEDLESHLREAGYFIYHPQKHDITHQIAHYKAAKHIIAAEGSAIHLLGMVARPDQEIAVIVRRSSGATRNLAKHLEGFSGSAPHMLTHLTRSWRPKEGAKPRNWHGEIDMRGLQASLAQAGFISPNQQVWPSLSQAEVREWLGRGYEVVSED